MHPRTVIAVAAIATTALGVTSCGPKGSDSAGGSGKGGSLTVLIGANAERAAEQELWKKRLQQQFKTKTGAELKFDTFASASDEQTKIQTSVVSGTGPDVYQLGTTFTPVAYGTGAFIELTDDDWAKVGGKDRFFPPQLAMSGPDPSRQIGVPFTMRPFAMVYNTELFAKAGLTAPPKTWDEYVAYAKKLNRPADKVYGTAVDYADGFNPWKYIWTNTLQSGGRLVSDDLKTAHLNSPEVVSSFDAYFGLLTEHRVTDPKSVSWKGPDALAAFASGRAGMLAMVTPGSEPTLKKSVVKGKYVYAPMPTVPFGATQRPEGGQPVGTIVSGDNVAIAKYTKDKDLALSYIDLITGEENQQYYYEHFGDLPTNQKSLTTLTAKDKQAAAFVEAGRDAKPTSFTGAWAQVQLGLTNVVVQSQSELASGRYDAAKVRSLLDAEQQKLQSALDRQNK